MDWKIIRDENKNIIKYELTDNIYIIKEKARGIYSNLSDFVLMLDGRKYMADKLKVVKAKGLKYLAEKDIPVARSEIKYHTKDNVFKGEEFLINKYSCQVFNSFNYMIDFIYGVTRDEVIEKYNKLINC